MYIWDPDKSLQENINIQAQVEALEKIAENGQRQNGVQSSQGEFGIVGKIIMFIFWGGLLLLALPFVLTVISFLIDVIFGVEINLLQWLM
jgi:thiol:disulfide interchange protein